MDVRFWIARRMRLSGSTGNAVSTGNVIAICGVALAVAVMELTLAIVCGFKQHITAKVTGFESQVTICPPLAYDDAVSDYIHLDSALISIIGEVDANASPVLSMQYPGVLKTDGDFAGVVYLAYDENRNRSFELENTVEGEFPDFSRPDNVNNIAISRLTANALNLEVGNKVYSCYFAQGTMKTRRHTVVAIYESNLSEFDKMVVYASMASLQGVLGVDSISGNRIEFDGLEKSQIDSFADSLRINLLNAASTARLDNIYPVTDVLHTGAIYFNWLALLDTNVAVIFVLMLCVAGFTLVASLYMIVLDRIPTIGLLRSLGTSGYDITTIFLSMGMKLTVWGLVMGNVLGLGLCFLQSVTRLFKLDPEMYYLKYVPVEVVPWQIVVLNIAVLVVAAAVLYIPSKSASKVDPASTMRQE